MRTKRYGTVYDTIKIPNGLTKKIDELIKQSNNDFTSRTDVIKFAIRLLYRENYYIERNLQEIK